MLMLGVKRKEYKKSNNHITKVSSTTILLFSDGSPRWSHAIDRWSTERIFLRELLFMKVNDNKGFSVSV